MAAPMRDGPPEGHRARAADGTRAEQANNFEYDDNEWDIGIGDLIIDLDADIEKTDEGTAGAMASAAGGPAKAAAKLADHSATLDKGLKMKIKRTKPGTKTSEAKHEIVKSNELNGNAETVTEGTTPVASPAPVAPGSTTPAGAPPRRASAAHRRDKKHVPANSTPEVNGVTPTATAPAPVTPASNPPAASVEAPQQPPATPEVTRTRPAPPIVTAAASPPPPKKAKTEPKECADVCVGTSVGTITEPDCLGPCEPGTSVTLEGIVWHETEGGVLVVNVTWRGKTYVGTLLDCTRHDWAPPRFCDSPTEELDARTPKGRAKRGRGAIPGGDLSNFTETRSSVHSKLRNGGPKGRRGGAAGAGASTTAPLTREAPSPPSSARASPSPAPSPAPPAPPGKRKTRGPEEDSPAGKRRPPVSPPASPALLECPEPNCSKKYKHINGLKYHQSHAHGAIDEDESKDNASLSENEESNVEAPSPTDPVKSPEKVQEPGTPKKEERQESLTPAATPVPSPADASRIPRAPSPTSASIPPVPTTVATNQSVVPPTNQNLTPTAAPTSNAAEAKPPPIKPGVLRFGPQEDFPVANFISKLPINSPAVVAPVPGNVPPIPGSVPTVPNNVTPTAVRPPDNVPRQFSVLSQGLPQPPPTQGPPLQHAPHQPMPVLPIPNHIQHPVQQNPQIDPTLPQNIGPQNQQKGPPPSPQNSQFKVKPTAALMPTDDKKLQDGLANNKPPQTQQIPSSQIPPSTQILPQVQTQPQNFKKTNNNSKNRKSPGGSPSPDRPQFGIEPPSRDEVQSPAYSDISDDNAPESDVDKAKVLGDKKPDGAPLTHGIPSGYGMYPFFGQTPYLVPSVQNPNLTDSNKLKDDPNKPSDGKSLMTDKDMKRELPPDMPPQKMLPHYYPYGYMPPGYPYNLDPNYGPVSMVPEDKLKEHEQRERERNKESPNPVEHNKPPPASPQQQSMLTSVKPKQSDMMKDGKHPNENHQILKESIEMKNQMNPYLYQRHHQQQQAQHAAQQQAQHQAQQQAQQQAHQQAQHQAHQQAQHQAHQREEELRRFYMEHQRRKESAMGPDLGKQNMPPQSQGHNKPSPSNPNLNKPPPPKECKPPEESAKSLVKEEPKAIKQEGQKPTMETTGPPPPPTSQFYLHPSYMPPPHYGGLPFDPMYRGLNPMIVSSPYGPGPYLHPSAMQRYNAAEDLSRPPPPPAKALDILQHHANQYYSSHKIHELQERALKSPTPKAPSAGGSPGGSAPGGSGAPPPPTSKPPPAPPSSTAEPTPGKDSRSPPPQRHVHTHHHTHVGLGYPLYPAPYGAAAVLASQQAAAVTVVNNFPPK